MVIYYTPILHILYNHTVSIVHSYNHLYYICYIHINLPKYFAEWLWNTLNKNITIYGENYPKNVWKILVVEKPFSMYQ